MDDAQGVGLAATQVGVLQRVFVFEPEDEEPTRASSTRGSSTPPTRQETEEEGCLSLEGVRVPVERSTKVDGRGRGPERRRRCGYELEGLGARVVQHEIDHLDGVLIIDRTDAEHRKEALGELRPQTVLALVRLAVAATAPFGADVLERLAARHEIAYLLTRPDAPRGRGRKLAPPPAKEAAERLGIPVHQPERPELPPSRVDAVVVCAYGLLIPRRPARRRRSGSTSTRRCCPRWRGAAPVERAILAGRRGDRRHDPRDREGARRRARSPRRSAFPIAPEDDAGAVFARAAEVAARAARRRAAGSRRSRRRPTTA